MLTNTPLVEAQEAETTLEFLLRLPWLPHSRERSGPPSNSEVRRWLERGSVQINGKAARKDDVVEYPITSLVFFGKSKSRTTFY